MTIEKAKIEAAASAIADVRAMRRGVPPISNAMEMLKRIPGCKIYGELMEEAEAALKAAEAT